MPTSKFWQVKNEVNGGGEILLYGPIAGERSWFGDEATPQQFAEDLESLGGRDVIVRINSGGGDVFAAHAIHNLLRSYKGRVTVMIDGLAASAATVVAMAGDRIVMPDNALFMIHNPAIGLSDYYGADELLRAAEALKTIKGSIVAAYQRRCKASADELAAMMDAETWLGANECLEKGFIDEVQGSVSAVLKKNMLVINSAEYDISRFKNIVEIKNHVQERGEFKLTQLESILNKLGLQSLLEEVPATKNAVPAAAPAQAVEQPAAAAPAQGDNVENAIQAAVAAERQRIADLEALDGGDNAAVTAIINAAKKDGKQAADVQPYIDAVKAAAPVANTAQGYVANMITDNKGSGVDGIGAGGGNEEAAAKAADDVAINRMAEVMNKKFGGAK